MAARSEAWVSGLRVRIAPGYESLSFVSVVCCQVEVSVSDRSLVQTSHAVCGVSEYDLETSKKRRPWPTRAVEP